LNQGRGREQQDNDYQQPKQAHPNIVAPPPIM
jgi:hypothetical protein